MFLEAQKKAHCEVLLEWKKQFESLGLPEEEEFRIYRFGKADENVAVDELLPPITLHLELGGTGKESRKVKVELSGRTEPVGVNVPCSLLLLTGSAAEKHYLQGFLDYLFLNAAGFEFKGNYRAILLSTEKPQERKLGPLDKQSARDYLTSIITEILFNTHAYLLPVEAVLDYWGSRDKDKDKTTIFGSVMKFRESDRASYSSLYGPVPHPEKYDPPDEKRALEIIQNRFGLFFKLGDASK